MNVRSDPVDKAVINLQRKHRWFRFVSRMEDGLSGVKQSRVRGSGRQLTKKKTEKDSVWKTWPSYKSAR